MTAPEHDSLLKLSWKDLVHISLKAYQHLAEHLIADLSRMKGFSCTAQGRLIEGIDIGKEFEASSHTFEGYTLKEHSLRVLTRLYQQYPYLGIEDHTTHDSFALMLTLHDIGKNLSMIHAGNKKEQHDFTVPLIKEILKAMGREKETFLFSALLDMDPLGAFLKGWISLEETLDKITQGARMASCERKTFFHILYAYYLCDASSYTGLMGRVFEELSTGQIIIKPDHSRIGEFHKLKEIIQI